jgi:RimJ/RimL family protein N-acetyltransferase
MSRTASAFCTPEVGSTSGLPQHDARAIPHCLLNSAYHTAQWLLFYSPSLELEKMVVVDPKYIVRTERLLLRPMKLEDAEDVVLLRKDAEVMKHTYVAFRKY